MDAINKALDLYIIKFNQDNQSSSLHYDTGKLDDDIHRYITIAVKSIPSASSLFRNNCIFDSLINALLICVTNEEEVKPLENAYRYLEKYFFLLMQQPWKPEYRTLKMYGGFYKTKIKSVLWKAECIFMSAGYDEDHNNTMVYRKSDVDKPQLLILSFDCFVAYVICQRIGEHYNQLKTVGKTLDDAISDLLQKSWPQGKARDNMVMTNKSSFKKIDPPEIPKREPVQNGSSNARMPHKTVLYSNEPSPVYDASISSQDPEQFLGNFKYKSNMDSHIPFMDEAEHYPQLSKGTVEDHMRKSMKLVNESSNQDSTITYPPGTYPQKYYPPDTILNTEYYKEEGINTNISVPPKSTFGLPTSYTKSVLSDQGYGSGSTNSSPIYIQTGPEMISETIYRPPAINSDMNIVSSVPMIKDNIMPPPPIPSRHLKPSFKSLGSDMVDGRVTVRHNGNGAGIQPTRVAIPPSSDNIPIPIGALNIGNNLSSRRSLHQIKSSSLKSDSKKIVNDNRVTKSMDGTYDRWKCPNCLHVNSCLATNCLQCTFNPHGSSTEPPLEVSGGLKKTCTACTYDNSWNSKHCEVCNEILP